MAINFPNPATLNQTYTVGTKTWVYNGYAWDLVLANTAPILSVATSAFNQANVAYTQANTGIYVGQGAFGQANTGVTIGQAGFAQANAAYTQANAAYTQANTGVTTGQNAFSQANAAYTQANTGILIGQGAFAQANSEPIGKSAFAQANAAYNTANTKFSANGGTIFGSVTITTDLNVNGNVYLSGNVTTLSSNNLSVNDPLIYLAQDNPVNLQDIGIVGHFTSNKYQHTGIARDATDGVWKLFSNVSAEPTTTIDFSSDVIYDPLKVGSIITSNAVFLVANGTVPFIVSSSTLIPNLNVDLLDGQHGTYYTGLTSSAFTQANNGVTIGQAAFTQANTALTVGQSAFGQANTALTVGQAAFTQANTSVTIGQAAFAAANTETIGKAAFTQANTKFSSSGGTITGNTTVIGVVTGNTFVSTIATGTAPLTVSSTTVVTNLNVDYLDGQHGSYYTTAGNLSGTIPSAVLGNSTHYIGTTAVALNRASASLALTGITSIDGKSAAVSCPDGDRNPNTKLPITNPNTVRFDFCSASPANTGGNYAGVMTYAPWDGSTGSTGDASYQLAFGSTAANGGGVPQLNIRKGIDSTWNTWYTILHSGNYTTYASPLAGSSSITTTGTVTSGTWSGSFGAVSGANLTGLTAGNLSGTIPSTVIANSKLVDWKNQTAQFALTGGGTVTTTTAAILWSARVIAIPVENSEYSASGYIDINCPTSGTVVYYNGSNITTTVTCTAAGIPLAAWEALYYQVTEGQTSTSDQTKFRVISYQNSTWSPGVGWICIAVRNGDDSSFKWLPGQVNIPQSSNYVSSTGIGSWASGAAITNDTTTNASYYLGMSSATSGSWSTAYVSSTKLYFNPSTGTLNSTVYNSLSDESVKTNISVISDSLSIIDKINGVEFNWIDNNKPSAGVIAQQLETVLPALVDTSESGLKSVNYLGIIGYLIEAIKELNREIVELKNIVNKN